MIRDVALELQDLRVGYGAVEAVRGVTLALPRGEIAAVLGPNGAGKTTLLRAISGVLRPQAGRVLFEGEDITGLDPVQRVRRGIVHVPEGRQVFPLLTVRENLLMGGYARARGRRTAADLDGVYRLFPILRERSAQLAGLLSGGQQQMLALGRALMAGPRLILLDEPGLGLSPKLSKEIFEIVVRINRELATPILLIEQNALLALNAADSGYLLENGSVVMQGRCEDLREQADIKSYYLGGDEETAETGIARAPLSTFNQPERHP